MSHSDNDSENASQRESGNRPAVVATAGESAHPFQSDPDPLARSRSRAERSATLDFKPLDYISFTRIIRKPNKWAEPRIESVEGGGIVVSIGRNRTRLNGELVQLGRVDAGPFMGVVTAVLDDAVVTEIQDQMELG